MSKIAVVYWSGTGNTEQMASMVVQGAQAAGAQVSLYPAGDFSSDLVPEFDALAFGCPSMGNEQLEESEFEPMFSACLGQLQGKKIGLFGSYGWGDGEWMRTWCDTCRSAGALLVSDGVICNSAPDDAAEAECQALGASLAG